MTPEDPDTLVVGADPEPPSRMQRRGGVAAVVAAGLVVAAALVAVFRGQGEEVTADTAGGALPGIDAPFNPEGGSSAGFTAGWRRIDLPGGALLRAVDRGPEGWATAGPDWERDASAVWTSPDAVRWTLAAEVPGVALTGVAVTDRGVVAVGEDTSEDAGVVWRSPDRLEQLDDTRLLAVDSDGGRVLAGGVSGGRPALWAVADEPATQVELEGTPGGDGAVHAVDAAVGVAVGEVGGAPAVWQRQADGSWRHRPGPGDHPLTVLAATREGGVMVGGGTQLWSSADLADWEPGAVGEFRALTANGSEVLGVEHRPGLHRAVRLAGGARIDALQLAPGGVTDLEVAETVVAVGSSPERSAALWVVSPRARDVDYRVEEGAWRPLALVPTPEDEPALEPVRLPAGTFVWTLAGTFLVTEGGSTRPLDPAPPPGGWLAGRVELGDRVITAGPDGEVWVGTDGGRRWTEVTLDDAAMLAVTLGDGEVLGVARSSGGLVSARSPDGERWEITPIDTPWDPVLVEGVPGGFAARDGRTGDRLVSPDGALWDQPGPFSELAAWAFVRADLPTQLDLAAAGVDPLDLGRERFWSDGEGVWRVADGSLVRFAGGEPAAVPLDVDRGLWASRLNPVPRDGQVLVAGVLRGQVAVWEWSGG